MPYNVDTGKAIICPPKNGTTMIQALWKLLGLRMECADHVPYQAMAEHIEHYHGNLPMQWAMNVRHPEQRLASMVNSQLYGRHGSVDRVIAEAVIGEWILIQPQSRFLEGVPDHLDITLFKHCPSMPIAAWFGWQGDVPVVNESRGTYSLEELRQRPGWQQALAMYESDWKLWEQAQ